MKRHYYGTLLRRNKIQNTRNETKRITIEILRKKEIVWKKSRRKIHTVNKEDKQNKKKIDDMVPWRANNDKLNELDTHMDNRPYKLRKRNHLSYKKMIGWSEKKPSWRVRFDESWPNWRRVKAILLFTVKIKLIENPLTMNIVIITS